MTKTNKKAYLEVLPVVAILSFVLIMGIFNALVQSLGYLPFLGMKEFSLKYYKEVLSSTSFLRSLGFTIYISTVSSSISIVLGLILARIVKRYGGEFFFRLPIIIPHIIVALFAISFLSDTDLLFNSNGRGIILAYVWKEVPFILLSCLSILKKTSTKYELAAINLGASRWYAFRKVGLPILLPTILSTFTIVFAFSFGAYEIPMLLGSTKPRALAVEAFVQYQNPMMENRPYAMAINMIIVGLCILCLWMFNYVVKKMILGRNYEEDN